MKELENSGFLGSSSTYDHLSCYVFWKDKHLRYQGGNAQFLNAIGLEQHILGRTDYDMPWAAQAVEYTHSDLLVLNGKSILSKELRWHVEGERCVVVNKLPIRDEKNQLIGILGLHQDATECIEFNNSMGFSLIKPLSNLIDSNELSLLSTLKNLLNNMLTAREIECLSLWLGGYSIKEAAYCLKLSHKSIEAYRKNVKDKMSVYHKSQLIDLLRERGDFHLFLTFAKLIREKSKSKNSA